MRLIHVVLVPAAVLGPAYALVHWQIVSMVGLIVVALALLFLYVLLNGYAAVQRMNQTLEELERMGVGSVPADGPRRTEAAASNRL